ncbi:MAG: cytosine deaminase [Actinomycetota bacterium]
MRTVFSNCLLQDGASVDVVVEKGVVTAVAPHRLNGDVDMGGRLLLGSFAEPHAHVDKAFLAERVRNPTNDLMGAIVALEEARPTITPQDTYERAMRALRLYASNGVSRVRTHADTTDLNGLDSVKALLAAKHDARSFIDVQVAMLLSWPVTGVEGRANRELAEEAVSAGVDVVGGCPHLDRNPASATRYFVKFAVESGLPLDLHTDENLRDSSNDLEDLVDAIDEIGQPVHVSASHCVTLSLRSGAEQSRIAAKLASAGVSVIVLPQTNLFLQGHHTTTSVPRAIAPVNVLRDHGVMVAAGGDNLQDPFNLMGRGDPLETANLLVTAGHVSPDAALDAVASSAHAAVGCPPPDVRVGARADFVALRATTIREAIAMGPPDRIVVYGGVVVSHKNETESKH